MALKELNVKTKKPENLAGEEDDDLEIELLEEEFNPNLGLEDDDDDDLEEEHDEDWENDAYDEDQEDDDDDSDEDEEDEDEGSDEEDSDDDDLEEEDDDDDEDEEEGRGPRENARIRQLIEERNKEREARKKQIAENHELTKKMVTMQKNTVESSKNVLTNHVEALQAQMVKAQEDGDNTKYVELQSKLNKAQMDLVAQGS